MNRITNSANIKAICHPFASGRRQARRVPCPVLLRVSTLHRPSQVRRPPDHLRLWEAGGRHAGTFISRAEFISRGGDGDDFDQVDADGDGVISAAEALAAAQLRAGLTCGSGEVG